MAHIVPTGLTRLALSKSQKSEIKTLNTLKQKLSSNYMIFHGVHWTREFKSETRFGEIDFIILNQSGSILVIEQKNGPVKVTKKGLVKWYNKRPKNVGQQVLRSIGAIREKFRSFNKTGPYLNIDYIIYCPDQRLKKLSAPSLDRSRIVHAGSKDNLTSCVKRVLGPGKNKKSILFDQVKDFFLEKFNLVPDIHAFVKAQDEAFMRLTGSMVDVLNNLDMTPYRLRVRAVAGCGKSMAVTNFYHRALREGHRPLLLCFNRSLNEKMKECVRPGGMVATWHGLIDQYLIAKGHSPDYSRMYTDPNFWSELQDLVVSEKSDDDWIFDYVIVDEGQDFEPEWLQILRLFLSENHSFVWFEDPDQNIRRAPVPKLGNMVTYHVNTNYRSPEKVARFIQKALPFKFEIGNMLPGYEVNVHQFNNEDEQVDAVRSRVQQLVRRGFALDKISIISCRGAKSSVFHGIERLGDFPLRRFLHEYDDAGRQLFSKGELLFDSIYRFKGQQADAVLLVDVDPPSEDPEHNDRVLYCGMTRAGISLDVYANATNPITDRLVRALY